jgi:dTDP-4-amino-4,6-dideoxygalactose transaminase
MDPDKIEAAITPATTCIMPVHVYGKPCDTKRIQEIADKYGLKIIYDAAHAFGVEVPAEKYGLEAYDDKGLAGIMNAGDMSTLSFHATKVFNTIEGGALVVRDEKTKKRIDNLKNFGITDDVTVVAPGINGKMDEMRSAYGLLNLKQVDAAIESRHQVAIKYREALRPVDGITFWDDMPGVRHNYSYFPIFIEADKFGTTRDELFFKMREKNIWSRRYFYPLISNFDTYSGLPSAAKDNLPVGNKMADKVLCLPMHHVLSDEEIQRIINCLINK